MPSDVLEWYIRNGFMGLTLVAAWAFVLYALLWWRTGASKQRAYLTRSKLGRLFFVS